jgi:hypothetical protein
VCQAAIEQALLQLVTAANEGSFHEDIRHAGLAGRFLELRVQFVAVLPLVQAVVSIAAALGGDALIKRALYLSAERAPGFAKHHDPASIKLAQEFDVLGRHGKKHAESRVT